MSYVPSTSALICPGCDEPVLPSEWSREVTSIDVDGTPLPEAVSEQVNHPQHYGGGGDPYEAIKVIDAWGLGFCLGNTVKYIARAGKKGERLTDLRKAAWYLQHEIEQEATRANQRT